MPESLEDILRRRQDALRGRPETKWELLAGWASSIDWVWGTFELAALLALLALAAIDLAVILQIWGT